MNKKRTKRIAHRYIVLLLGDEVSVWLDKRKGFIYRKSYSSKSNAIQAYKNINSVKAIKRFVGKEFDKLYQPRGGWRCG